MFKVYAVAGLVLCFSVMNAVCNPLCNQDLDCNESLPSCGGHGSSIGHGHGGIIGHGYGGSIGGGYGGSFGGGYGSHGLSLGHRRQVVSCGRPIIIRPESNQYHVPTEPIHIHTKFTSNSHPVCLNPRICVNSRAGGVEVNPVIVKVIKEVQRPCYVPAPAPCCGCEGGENYSSGCGCGC